MNHVIIIRPDGVVTAMHNDQFPLGFLGNQTITRASDIRFDADSQTWGIWFFVDGEFVPPGQPTHYGFDSYEAARDKEVQVMNVSLSEDRCPLAVQ